MPKMLSSISKLLDHIESKWSLYSQITAGIAVTGVGTLWASYSEWISSFGSVAWVIVGLLITLMASAVAALIANYQATKESSRLRTEWSGSSDLFNPMDHNFSNKRIFIADLIDPVTNRVENKVFVNCDLIGPANISFGGTITMHGTLGSELDLCEIRDEASPQNAVNFVNVTIADCRLSKITILIPSSFYNRMSDFHPRTITRTDLLPLEES